MHDHKDWTEDEIVNLKRCIDAGISLRAAAVAMGRSFNSVGGKAKRLGLAFHSRDTRPNRAYVGEKEAAKAGIVLAPGAITPTVSPRPKPKPRPEPTPFDVLDPAETVTFEEIGVPLRAIGERQCRAIVAGDSAYIDQLRYCGEATAAGKSWCAAHGARYTASWASRKLEREERRAARQPVKLGRWS